MRQVDVRGHDDPLTLYVGAVLLDVDWRPKDRVPGALVGTI